MGLEQMNEKQLRDRMRFLSDKIEETFIKISPMLKEIDELKVEFEEIYLELDDRGLMKNEQEST